MGVVNSQSLGGQSPGGSPNGDPSVVELLKEIKAEVRNIPKNITKQEANNIKEVLAGRPARYGNAFLKDIQEEHAKKKEEQNPDKNKTINALTNPTSVYGISSMVREQFAAGINATQNFNWAINKFKADHIGQMDITYSTSLKGAWRRGYTGLSDFKVQSVHGADEDSLDGAHISDEFEKGELKLGQLKQIGAYRRAMKLSSEVALGNVGKVGADVIKSLRKFNFNEAAQSLAGGLGTAAAFLKANPLTIAAAATAYLTPYAETQWNMGGEHGKLQVAKEKQLAEFRSEQQNYMRENMGSRGSLSYQHEMDLFRTAIAKVELHSTNAFINSSWNYEANSKALAQEEVNLLDQAAIARKYGFSPSKTVNASLDWQANANLAENRNILGDIYVNTIGKIDGSNKANLNAEKQKLIAEKQKKFLEERAAWEKDMTENVLGRMNTYSNIAHLHAVEEFNYEKNLDWSPY